MAPARSALLLSVAMCTGLLAGCTGTDEPATPFTEVNSEAGLDYVIDGLLPHTAPPWAKMGGGLAVADVDDNGWPDIYVADSGPNALYLNQGDGTFEEASKTWGAQDPLPGRAPVFFDYDNDGDADLFIGNFITQSKLLRNDGDAFTDVSEASGLNFKDTVFNAAVADVDGDGYQDLFVGVYGNFLTKESETFTTADNGDLDRLYMNNGDGTFTEEAQARGINGTFWTLASSFADFDEDGDQDLYVAIDFHFDKLYVNDGTGNFTDRAHELGAISQRHGMSADWFDHDGDGDLDMYVTNIYVGDSPMPGLRGNVLFRNDGGRFTEIGEQAGVADGGWGWDAEAFDYENDGDLDIYSTNGFFSGDPWDKMYDAKRTFDEDEAGLERVGGYYNDSTRFYYLPNTSPPGVPMHEALPSLQYSEGGYQHNRFFVNDGDGTYTETGSELGVDLIGDTRATALLDYDQDGDLDMVVTAREEPLHLLRNDVDNGNHWLQIELQPREGEAAIPYGARIEAHTPEGVHMATLKSAAGFMSQSEPVVHFGLGNATVVEELVVVWPDGTSALMSDLTPDQRLLVEQG